MSFSRRLLLLGTVAAAAATVLLPTRATQHAAVTHVIEISNFGYLSNAQPIYPGDTVTWINRDIVPHTATADDNSWDSGTIATDESRSLVIKRGALRSYYCQFHPGMKGVLVAPPTS